MIGYIIKKVIGSRNDREVKRMRPIVAKINEDAARLAEKENEWVSRWEQEVYSAR